MTPDMLGVVVIGVIFLGIFILVGLRMYFDYKVAMK